MDYEFPKNAERKRFLWYLENRCIQGYVANLASSLFGTSDLADLDTDAIRCLVMTLKHRPNAWRPRHQAPDPADCPF
jgi:hypothetical protein